MPKKKLINPQVNKPSSYLCQFATEPHWFETYFYFPFLFKVLKNIPFVVRDQNVYQHDKELSIPGQR